MAKKKSKCYSLSNEAIFEIVKVQKEHDFESESAALEYMIIHNLNKDRIKEMIYEILGKIMLENNISLNVNSLCTVKEEVKTSADEEFENFLADSTKDIMDSMPD